jgi:hypothetical protein
MISREFRSNWPDITWKNICLNAYPPNYQNYIPLQDGTYGIIIVILKIISENILLTLRDYLD